MGDVTKFPTDESDVVRCLEMAKDEADSLEAQWVIVILPDGDASTVMCSHIFSHARLCGHLEEAKSVSLLSEIEAVLSE